MWSNHARCFVSSHRLCSDKPHSAAAACIVLIVMEPSSSKVTCTVGRWGARGSCAWVMRDDRLIALEAAPLSTVALVCSLKWRHCRIWVRVALTTHSHCSDLLRQWKNDIDTKQVSRARAAFARPRS